MRTDSPKGPRRGRTSRRHPPERDEDPPEAYAMTRRFLTRPILALLLCVSGSLTSELEAGPMRSAQAVRQRNFRQQTWQRIRNQANRVWARQRPALTERTISGLTGLHGASFLNVAGQSLSDSAVTTTSISALTATATQTASLTLQDVWNSLARDMRFANQLAPDATTGLLPNTPFVADILNRRAVNQARFDTYHPVIAQYLDWDEIIRNDGGTTPLNPAVRPPVPTGPTVPQVIVPEPSSVLVAVALIGFAVWSRRQSSPA